MVNLADERAAEIIKRTVNINFPSVAEIGVYRGTLSRRLLYRNGLHLLMVDPWGEVEFSENDWYAKDGVPEDWEDAKQEALGKVMWAKDRVRVYQGTSEGAAGYFDEKFDIVFIDAEHTYEACSKDLALWWPKVVQGGYLGGHDYGRPEFGVTEAANEFAEENGLEIQLGLNYTYFFQKPIDHHTV